MFYTIAADLVIFVHFLWIAFVILGFPVFLYFNLPKWRVLHLVAATNFSEGKIDPEKNDE